ncbi:MULTISPECIES: helix-turn-helix transcriptional regulator [Clostridia]|uniref:Helix-turn-helix transcriptional regulator n=1 Tax=Pseudoflavonifractor intestinihominis TaxID=3133171 RepID=A0ABV1E5T8_9FIRM|nr:helix-turn-helix transcriptional regulator [Anaerostipes butyraticus]
MVNNIKLLREKKGISQAALASQVGVCPQAVGKWERGESDPKWAIAPALADALHCSIDELYGRTPPEAAS